MLETPGFLNGKISKKFKIEMWDPVWIFSFCFVLILLHCFSWLFSVGILVPFQFYFIFLYACMCVLCDNLLTGLTVFTHWNIFDFSCKIYRLYFSSQIWLKTGSGVLEMPWSKWTSFPEELCCQLIIWLGRTSPTSIFLISFSVENSYFLVSEFSFILYCYFPLIVTLMWKSS